MVKKCRVKNDAVLRVSAQSALKEIETLWPQRFRTDRLAAIAVRMILGTSNVGVGAY